VARRVERLLLGEQPAQARLEAHERRKAHATP
jgi:hypothetical protein